MLFKVRPNDIKWIEKVHDKEYLKRVSRRDVEITGDIYTNDLTWQSILKCVDCVLAVVDSVLTGTRTSGVAIIRPPGHHAEHSQAEGFCFVNNVCVGANYAIEKYDLKR